MKLTARTAHLAPFACLAFVLAVGSPTHHSIAATVTNGDRVTHTITIIMGTSRKTHELKPGGLLKDLCERRCIVRLDEKGDKDFVLDGSERVTIEDGLLYYDGEVAVPQKPKAK